MPSSLIALQYCYDLLPETIPTGLLLYSHIPTALLALLFSLFLLHRNRSYASVYLLALCAAFAVWSVMDLVTWFAFLGSASTIFAWSLLDVFSLIFFISAYWFLFSFSRSSDIPFAQKLLTMAPLLPVLIASSMGVNVTAFDVTSCEIWENSLTQTYTLITQLVLLLLSGSFTVREYFLHSKAKRIQMARQILLAGTGTTLFLSFFFLAFVATQVANNLGWLHAHNFEIYGLFGMPLLIVYLTYVIIRYNAFNLKLFASEALVSALTVLIASQFFFVRSKTNLVLTAVTLLITIVFGFFLVRNVRKEIESRRKGEQLARYLANANARLRELDTQKTEFVSIASHQLRSPITAMIGYASLLLDGSYGELPEKMRVPVQRMYDSGRHVAIMVDDFLNVTRIEQGHMTFSLAEEDVCKIVSNAVEELRMIAEQKGLAFQLSCASDGPILVSADEGKLKQVFTNLMDNAIKYTKQGSISVFVRARVEDERAEVTIADTGIGIAAEDIPFLFHKFNRASNANAATVYGTGLGLYIVKEILRAHKGDVSISSPGVGKGTTFTVVLPLARR